MVSPKLTIQMRKESYTSPHGIQNSGITVTQEAKNAFDALRTRKRSKDPGLVYFIQDEKIQWRTVGDPLEEFLGQLPSDRCLWIFYDLECEWKGMLVPKLVLIGWFVQGMVLNLANSSYYFQESGWCSC